jgi:peroxiredoxin
MKKSLLSAAIAMFALASTERDRKLAPDFTLKDSIGATVKLSDYKGKVVLLDFWATWCDGCRVEIPWLMEFEQTYRDKGFAVLGVSMDEDGWNAVKPFLRDRKLNYRILMGSEQVAQLYGGLNALPETFLIDRTGRIASVHVGIEAGKEGFRSEITQLLVSQSH